VGALGCGEDLRAGRATVGVGRTVGSKGTAAWPLQQRLLTMANSKVRKGWTEVRGHGSTTCVTRRSSEVQLSQRADAQEIRSSRWERLVAVRICERIRRIGSATGGVGRTAGNKGTAAWPLQVRLPTMTNLKVRSRCKGRTEVRGPGPTTYVAGMSSEVQLSQRVDAQEIRSSSRWERLVAVRICELGGRPLA
jgi:hypothetical protein